ncbi:MAG: TIGR02270 family protein [Pseudomonadota bacterium]
MKAYREIYDQLSGDASFLWLLRNNAVNQPNFRSVDLLILDRRVDTRLDGLMAAPEESWELCAAAMVTQQAGEVFAAAVLAFRSLDVSKIQCVIEVGLTSPQGFQGLVSALGWLPGRLCHSWIKKFLTSKDLNHKYLAVAACSVRREDPREYLTAIFQREDCIAHEKLYARSLRLVGELKRRDLSAALPIAMQSENPDVLFWASWSAVMLGDKSFVKNLQPFVLKAGAHQARAIELAFRVLPVETARVWISELAKDPEQIRNVIKATANLGDPHAINWLIAQMRVPVLTRLAGEAFTTITGIDLEEHRLALEELPDLDALLAPNEDPTDANVKMDEDDRLPFPDVDKIAAVWQKYQQRFVSGQHYFLGQVITVEHLTSVYNSGNQHQRRAAALELALLQPAQYLLNHAFKGLAEDE